MIIHPYSNQFVISFLQLGREDHFHHFRLFLFYLFVLIFI